MTWDEIFECKGPDRDYDHHTLGPILKSDAALLAGILNYVKPRIAIEYGCLEGHSAAVLCRFVEKLYCVEVDNVRNGLLHVMERNPNIVHVHASMTQWDPPPEVEQIDLVYFDASHNFRDSRDAYLRIKSRLSQRTMIICHDTATWIEPMPQHFRDFAQPRFEAVSGERGFVRWLEANNWTAISFAGRELRHGLTVLQFDKGWEK